MELREARHEDLEALEELLEACQLADGHSPLGEHKYLDLVRGGGEDTLGLLGESDGQVIAYAHLSRNARSGVIGLEVAVHPLWRHPELISTLVQRALDSAAELGGREVHLWAYQRQLAGILRELGFQESRELRQLQRPLPPDEPAAYPTGLEVRPFRPGVDEEVWLEANNAAFAGHPENGAWDLDTLLDRERQPWFDPEGFRMAWGSAKPEELMGFCWTKLHPDRIGEIYVIATAPDHQGRGVGRALVLDGLWYLWAKRGATSAMLYVDSSNVAALGLYQQLGLHLDHVDRCFVAETAPT